MRVALAQLRIDPGAAAENRDRAVAAVADAAARGADLVALPEQFGVGFFAFEAYDDAAEPVGGETHRALADAAARHGVAVLAGTVVEDLAASADRGIDVPADEGLANTAALFDAGGERRLVYRKRHLFGHDSEEAARLVPGEALPTTDLGGFTVGVTTCYDLRFPEQYRALVDRGVDLVLVPSAWPYPRVEHWRVLPRARAIENLCYVAAVNGTGDAGGGRLVGRSTVFDPWGTPVASTGEGPATVVADLDPDEVADRRDSFPALADRR